MALLWPKAFPLEGGGLGEGVLSAKAQPYE
jgi:hypothetical protein